MSPPAAAILGLFRGDPADERAYSAMRRWASSCSPATANARTAPGWSTSFAVGGRPEGAVLTTRKRPVASLGPPPGARRRRPACWASFMPTARARARTTRLN